MVALQYRDEMSCSVFHGFPEPPGQGQVTLCEQYGEMSAGSTDHAQLKLSGYPDVCITKDSTRSLTQKENAKSAFLLHEETVSKRVYHAWLEMGVSGALQEILNSQQEVSSWMSGAAHKGLILTRWMNSLHGSFFPHLALSNEDMIAKFSNVSDWPGGPVKAFSWHPHTLKLAYALHDDTIRIHTSGTDLVPVLKHKLQKNVAYIAWQPQSASVLAVACQSCILVWHIEPTSLATRPSSSCVQVLQQPHHSPVVSLAWSPDGRVLVSTSPVHTAMLAWDVAMETVTPLWRLGGGGVAVTAWSPDGSKLFAATPSNLFRVWETRMWTCEKWSTSTGRCQAACWSPRGNILLFATENKPIIYSLIFPEANDDTKPVIGGSQTAVACVDLSETNLHADGEEATIKVGGAIQDLIWDPTGERLAVMFRDNRDYIALFRTKTSPVLEITPCGLVKGIDGETPQHIVFQPAFEGGALLTVAWSSGRVGYVPLYFVPAEMAEYHRFQQNPPLVNQHRKTQLFSQT